jgi:hypothetical protein
MFLSPLFSRKSCKSFTPLSKNPSSTLPWHDHPRALVQQSFFWDAWVVFIVDLVWLMWLNVILVCVFFLSTNGHLAQSTNTSLCALKNKWTKEDLHLSRIWTRLAPISSISWKYMTITLPITLGLDLNQTRKFSPGHYLSSWQNCTR